MQQGAARCGQNLRSSGGNRPLQPNNQSGELVEPEDGTNPCLASESVVTRVPALAAKNSARSGAIWSNCWRIAATSSGGARWPGVVGVFGHQLQGGGSLWAGQLPNECESEVDSGRHPTPVMRLRSVTTRLATTSTPGYSVSRCW